MAERRFEFSDDDSRKFWAIDVAGATVTVRFGKLGTAGTAKEKAHASPAEASKEAAKLIAEKTRKGYVEAGTAGSPATPAAPAKAPATSKAAAPATSKAAAPATSKAAAKATSKAAAPATTGEAAGGDALAETLAKLDAALVSYAPKAYAARVGATSFAALTALVPVPAALRTVWSWTDGGELGSGLFLTTISEDSAGQWESMLSVEQAAATVVMLRETAAFPETLIPFTTDGNGNFLVVDQAGVVFDWDHETRKPTRVTPSLAALLNRSLQAIKRQILFSGPEPGANVPNPAVARIEKLAKKISASKDPGGDLEKLVEVSTLLRDGDARLEVLLRPHIRAIAAAAQAHERRFWCSQIIEVGVKLDRWDDVLAVAPLGVFYWTSLGDGAVLDGAMERALRCFEQAVADRTNHPTDDCVLEGHVGAAFACAKLGRPTASHVAAGNALIDAEVAVSEKQLAAHAKKPDPKAPYLQQTASRELSRRLLYRAVLAIAAGDEALARRSLAERAKYDNKSHYARHGRISNTVEAALGALPAD